MLFWLFLIVLAIGIGLIIWYEYSDQYNDWQLATGAIATVVAGLAVAISIGCFINAYGRADAYVVQHQARYDSLVYQLENDLYDNDNDLGKKELYKEIQGWNEDLAYNKEIQDNFWLGIYYPNIYDQFEFIELRQSASENINPN